MPGLSVAQLKEQSDLQFAQFKEQMNHQQVTFARIFHAIEVRQEQLETKFKSNFDETNEKLRRLSTNLEICRNQQNELFQILYSQLTAYQRSSSTNNTGEISGEGLLETPFAIGDPLQNSLIMNKQLEQSPNEVRVITEDPIRTSIEISSKGNAPSLIPSSVKFNDNVEALNIDLGQQSHKPHINNEFDPELTVKMYYIVCDPKMFVEMPTREVLELNVCTGNPKVEIDGLVDIGYVETQGDLKVLAKIPHPQIFNFFDSLFRRWLKREIELNVIRMVFQVFDPGDEFLCDIGSNKVDSNSIETNTNVELKFSICDVELGLHKTNHRDAVRISTLQKGVSPLIVIEDNGNVLTNDAATNEFSRDSLELLKRIQQLIQLLKKEVQEHFLISLNQGIPKFKQSNSTFFFNLIIFFSS